VASLSGEAVAAAPAPSAPGVPPAGEASARPIAAAAEAAAAPLPEGPHASIEIKPIVVDEVIAEVPKKRGWWRR
jgi:hypothetical protein